MHCPSSNFMLKSGVMDVRTALNEGIKVALGSDVDLSSLAKETRGLVGADLAAIINEAAIRAARRGAALIGKTDVKNALSEYYESRSALNSEQFGPFSFAAPKEQPSN